MSTWITKLQFRREAAPGPLHGLTFAAKDNIDAAGIPTTAACPEFAYTPVKSATVVERAEAAGAVLAGKTNLDQFATGLSGTRSPYGICSSVFHERYISGGSSSGSAVAVAKGEVDFAFGTDTAGSGRVPAACNGIIGLKPTRGLLSMSGVVPACRSLDCVSIFARDTATAAAAFHATRGFDPEDPYSRQGLRAAPWSHGPFRFGVPPADQLEFFGDLEAEALFHQAVAKCQAIGGSKVEIDYQPFRDTASLLYFGPWVAERYAAVGAFLQKHPYAGHPVVRRIIEGATKYSAVDAWQSHYALEKLRRLTEPAWQQIDVLFLPTTGAIYTIEQMLADPVRLNTNLGYYTNFVNLLDLSAIAVPAGLRPNGLPFGVTFIARAFEDEGLLDLSRRWEGKPVSACPHGCVQLAVVGAHLTGQPLNHQLTTRGARLLRTCRTAPCYRLYALRNTAPPKPGLVRDTTLSGPGIEIEIWAIPESRFGEFVNEVPPPLAIGNLETAGGEWVKGFVCEPQSIEGSSDITAHAGWRNWLSTR
ncbi:MAG: allophanate hydrolase [Bryobacterales bacterium]|nr:allophanate hydrolase [Bryobacterales bacterium]